MWLFFLLSFYFSLKVRIWQILDVSGGQHHKFHYSACLTLIVDHLDSAL